MQKLGKLLISSVKLEIVYVRLQPYQVPPMHAFSVAEVSSYREEFYLVVT